MKIFKYFAFVFVCICLTACYDNPSNQATNDQTTTMNQSNHTPAASATLPITLSQFIHHYNQADYQAVFGLYQSSLQEILPQSENDALLKGLKNDLGNLVSLKKQIDGLYLASFEKGTLMLAVSLDDHQKINYLEFQPDHTSSAINHLKNYPKVIGTALFDTMKYLPNQSQIALAVIDGDQVNYYGAIRQANTIKTIDNQHAIFEIGSITKVLTATVLADMVTHN
ncbi:MAG: DUF3887 domain-containing protein, partial [Moraxella sp.]|nr:DUF3887 domain-containing protein [Moraxella sp.]